MRADAAQEFCIGDPYCDSGDDGDDLHRNPQVKRPIGQVTKDSEVSGGVGAARFYRVSGGNIGALTTSGVQRRSWRPSQPYPHRLPWHCGRGHVFASRSPRLSAFPSRRPYVASLGVFRAEAAFRA